MRKLFRFFQLRRSERYLLLFTLFWLTRIRAWLWLLPFAQVQRQLTQASETAFPYPFPPLPSVNTIVWAVQICSRYLPGKVRCLAQALTTQVIASQLGYSLDLQIGVTKREHGQLEAHAWVTYQGQVALGALPHLGEFVPIWSLSGEKP
jgi:hypothetical protein